MHVVSCCFFFFFRLNNSRPTGALGNNKDGAGPSSTATSLAITYPGYNYGQSAPSSSSSTPAPRSLPAVSYPGLGPSSGGIQTSTIPTSVPPPQQQVQYPASAVGYAPSSSSSAQKPAVQNTIMGFLNSNAPEVGACIVPSPMGVPPPVPAPAGVPPPQLMHPYPMHHQPPPGNGGKNNKQPDLRMMPPNFNNQGYSGW